MKHVRSLLRDAYEIAIGLAVFLVINTTAFASYYIPSESMVPNLLVGDRLVVTKYPYGYSRYSILGGPPLFAGRIFERPVERGDIVVFKLPRDGETDYIKRIVGLPGDTIETRHGVLVINDVPVQRERIGDLERHDSFGAIERVPQYRETLPSGRSYITLELRQDSHADNAGPFVVPAGHYFAMGDNRENSLDSRWPKEIGVGFVPAENLVGRAEAIVYSWSGEAELLHPATWLSAFRGERSVTRLH